MSSAQSGQCIRDVSSRVLWRWNRGEPELPEPAIRGGRHEPVPVSLRQRLESHAMAFENDGIEDDHLASPPIRPRGCALGIPVTWSLSTTWGFNVAHQT